jgi:hypothetical protein
MTRVFILTTILLSSTISHGSENYRIEINGHSYDIGLDTSKNIVLSNGETLQIKISLKDVIAFESRFFSFSHRKSHTPSSSVVQAGITQTIVSTSLGGGVLVQEYTTTDPTLLIDMMVRELVKEEIEYGYEYNESTVSKMIGDIELVGKEVITTYKDKVWVRHVFAYGEKDAGILIITFIENDNLDEDKHLIDDFWKSLRITF